MPCGLAGKDASKISQPVVSYSDTVGAWRRTVEKTLVAQATVALFPGWWPATSRKQSAEQSVEDGERYVEIPLRHVFGAVVVQVRPRQPRNQRKFLDKGFGRRVVGRVQGFIQKVV
jgi:hypothetical protein